LEQGRELRNKVRNGLGERERLRDA
jgi:hypothetical protein